MYEILQILEIIAILTFLICVVFFLRPVIKNWGKNIRKAAEEINRREQVHNVPTYQNNESSTIDVKEAQKATFKSMGLPTIHSGRMMMNVPSFNPEQEGWQKNLQVITTSRITALLKQGPIPGDLIELDGNYVIFATNNKTFLLQRHLLTSTEESQLEQERKEAVEKGDSIIPNFQGFEWKIGTACGSHTARNSGDKTQSTIQVLSIHPQLGQNGMVSCLPPNLLDQQEHDYYDMRARTTEGSNQIMLFFYSGGMWACFIGRELSQTESQALQAI